MPPPCLIWGHLILLADLSGELWHHFCSWALKNGGMTASVVISHCCQLELCFSITPAGCSAEVQNLLHEPHPSQWGIWSSGRVFYLGALDHGEWISLRDTWGHPGAIRAMARTFPGWLLWVWSLQHWHLEGGKAQMWKCQGDPWRRICDAQAGWEGTTGVPFPGGSQELKSFCFSRRQQHGRYFGTIKESAVTVPGLKIMEFELGNTFSLPCVLREAQWGKLKFPFCHLWYSYLTSCMSLPMAGGGTRSS